MDVTLQSDGSNLDFEFASQASDVILIDLGLPQSDGIEIIRQIRKLNKRVGIIVVSALSSISNKLKSLSSGADVYLLKPVDNDEIVANINSLFRRLEYERQIADPMPPVWELSAKSLALRTPCGEMIDLSPREVALLTPFAKSLTNQVALRDLVHADEGNENLNGYYRRIEVALARIRKKIRESNPAYNVIKSNRSSGYVFGAEIRLCE